MADMWAFLRRVKIRFTLRWVVIFCLVFQPIYSLVFSLPTYAHGEADPTLNEQKSRESTNATPSTVPINGTPHNITKLTTDFSFTWQPPAELDMKYELRISRDKTQVGQVADTSNAWYSPHLTKPLFPASSVSDFTDGMWYWQVRALDSDGNKSSWSAVWNVRVDTSRPMITVLRPVEAAVFGGPSPTLIRCDVRIHERELESFGMELDGIDATSQVRAVPDENGLHLTVDWDPKGLGDGSHTLRIWARDTFGHTQEATRTFSVDTTPPEITTSITEHQKLTGLIALDLNADEIHPGSYAIDIISAHGATITQAEVQGTGTATQNVSTLTRMWNTIGVADGTYQVRFVGRDGLGNETVLVRNVVVENSVASSGVITKDPLLEQLSASLNQPFISPQSGDAQSQLFMGTIPNIGDTESQKYDELLESVPQFTIMTATENGWQLFGILWYWWLLGGLLLALAGVRLWRTPGRSRTQQLLEGAEA